MLGCSSGVRNVHRGEDIRIQTVAGKFGNASLAARQSQHRPICHDVFRQAFWSYAIKSANACTGGPTFCANSQTVSDLSRGAWAAPFSAMKAFDA
jgi:hypothetical protein